MVDVCGLAVPFLYPPACQELPLWSVALGWSLYGQAYAAIAFGAGHEVTKQIDYGIMRVCVTRKWSMVLL